MESEHYEADFRVLALKALKKNPLKQKKKFEKLVKNIDAGNCGNLSKKYSFQKT